MSQAERELLLAIADMLMHARIKPSIEARTATLRLTQALKAVRDAQPARESPQTLREHDAPGAQLT